MENLHKQFVPETDLRTRSQNLTHLIVFFLGIWNMHQIIKKEVVSAPGFDVPREHVRQSIPWTLYHNPLESSDFTGDLQHPVLHSTLGRG